MFFYRMKVKTTVKAVGDEETRVSAMNSRHFREQCAKIAWDTPINAGIYALELDDEQITAVAIMDTSDVVARRRAMAEFCADLNWAGEFAEEEEITLSRLGFLLEESKLNHPTRGIFKKHGFDLKIRSELSGQELLIQPGMTWAKARKRCRELLCEDVLLPEIKRIFSRRASKSFVAHPVHYQIAISDDYVREEVRQLLLECLYAAGRLPSRRVYVPGEKIGIGRKSRWDMDELESMYKMQTGGVIVLPMEASRNDREGPHLFAVNDADIMDEALHLLLAHRRHVLTIMEWRQEMPPWTRAEKELLQDVAVVELREGCVSPRKARAFLRQRAKQDGLVASKSLLQKIPAGDMNQRLSSLRVIYSRWYDSYLRSSVYPDYKVLDAANGRPETPCGDAYRELSEMTGLGNVKEIVRQILDTKAAEKMMEKQGIPMEKSSLHMVFTGNPGTAKTTTARLLAQIFKDNGILSVGQLIEVGRADLIGQYVGSTAPLIRRAFAKAKGSLLFVDEAYSLLDGKRGLYGDEAINTLVQEMENRREDTIVVFAGYPKEMDAFLDRNPGLRSRIAFHVPFEDYSVEELLIILRTMVRKNNMKMDEEAGAFLLEKFRQAVKRKDNGNGRLARNVMDQAKMRHASRILREKDSTAAAVHTLTVEDFQVPAFDNLGEEKKAVGFCVA